MHEPGETEVVIDLADADHLPGEDGAEVGLLAVEADAPARRVARRGA